ncbi:MAG: hypothetical protein ACOVP5_00395, partial [Chitinophagales bacterium]
TSLSIKSLLRSAMIVALSPTAISSSRIVAKLMYFYYFYFLQIHTTSFYSSQNLYFLLHLQSIKSKK